MKVYLANGLFSEADRMYNTHLAKLLRENIEHIDLYVPQENGEINDKNAYADSIMIAKADTDRLKESDILVAVIDGIEIDAGVASEIGVFYMLEKPIIAIYTDVRQQGRDNKRKIQALIEDGTENQFMYRNLYTIGLIKERGKIVDNTNDLVKEVKKIAKHGK